MLRLLIENLRTGTLRNGRRHWAASLILNGGRQSYPIGGGGVKPPEDKPSVAPLYPWVNKDWITDVARAAAQGSAQSTLTRIEHEIGCKLNLRAHSPSSWYEAPAKQLSHPREGREN